MLKLRKILIMSLLLVPLSIGYTQSDSDDEENPITDPVLLEKLKQIDTMETVSYTRLTLPTKRIV